MRVTSHTNTLCLTEVPLDQMSPPPEMPGKPLGAFELSGLGDCKECLPHRGGWHCCSLYWWQVRLRVRSLLSLEQPAQIVSLLSLYEKQIQRSPSEYMVKRISTPITHKPQLINLWDTTSGDKVKLEHVHTAAPGWLAFRHNSLLITHEKELSSNKGKRKEVSLGLKIGDTNTFICYLREVS